MKNLLSLFMFFQICKIIHSDGSIEYIPFDYAVNNKGTNIAYFNTTTGTKTNYIGNMFSFMTIKEYQKEINKLQ